MKKLVTTTLLCLLTGGAAYSLPVGNPSEANLFTQGLWWGGCDCDFCDPCFCWFDAWDVRVGYYGDFVFNRHLEVDHEGTGRAHDIRETEINTNAGYFVLNICNVLDVFGTLGETRLRFQTNQDAWTTLSTNSDCVFLTDSSFSWSIGARAGLFSWKCFTVGIEGQYFRTHTDVTTFIDGVFNLYDYFNDNNEASYSEWQVGLGLSYMIKTVCPELAIVPYVATKWSRAHFRSKLEFTHQTGSETTGLFTLHNLKADKLWGFATGVTFTMCDSFGVTVEGRWCDEKALYVNGQFRF